ncbi:MAG: glutamine--tRNA ligase/YqeY domain fusion protein [Desulfovibrionaceae bacterium]|nr:glutamine--tRNA ligase/YqeY domain fusion protein [Desulfovibrionaceae bacterium]
MHEIQESLTSDFIRTRIKKDLELGKCTTVHTRFPPEPNGYLHIGHAKSICLNFALAEEYNGICNIRMDDTNPEKESEEYVEAIMEDIRWLGFTPGKNFFFASDYFEKLYELAEQLIEKGLAYVDFSTPDEMRINRGTLVEAGVESPYRNTSVEENLALFRKMRAGEFEDGTCVLRAKIDMSSPNISMRDPTIYRIRHAHHYRTGNTWCIYPMYDFTHCISDSFEEISHSLCSLEFENNRELYDWFLDVLELHKVQQIEFARLRLTYTVLSKRKLIQLVQEGHVAGWDDPRMPTIRGMKQRGYPASAIRQFCSMIGVSKANSIVDYEVLEYCVRAELNEVAPRYMAVRNPLKVVITNYPEDSIEELVMPFFPEDDSKGTRIAPFSREIYIERDDFMENPSKKYFRLAPGKEVRLRYAYYITCTDVIKDDSGEIVELRCTYDPETKGGTSPDGRKVKGTLHWVSVQNAFPITLRNYEHLFTIPNPTNPPDGGDFLDYLNPTSCVDEIAYAEPYVATLPQETVLQFERIGYYKCASPYEEGTSPCFTRITTLKDSFSKQKS